jgi:hypothetical protein
MIEYICARCGVNAFPEGTRSVKPGCSVLDLCLHHTTEHAPALKKQEWTTVSLRVLTENQQAPSPAGADA